MLHFPSSSFQSSESNGKLKKLNATQHKSSSDPSSHIFLKIEEELHDARRVQQHGQEDDLRMALGMVIGRVTELSNLLSETYKQTAELEVQLNVTKSNLQLVIANNEMLEEAIRSGSNVGWRSKDQGQHRSNSVDTHLSHIPPSSSLENSPSSPAIPNTPPPQPATPTTATTSDSRFFKFRFNSSGSSSKPASRPNTPTQSTYPSTNPPSAASSPKLAHLTSSSMPSLSGSTSTSKDVEDLQARLLELETKLAEWDKERTLWIKDKEELEKERVARKAVAEEKVALEAELESLSQALFEEANKMVAQERIKRAETEEELKEARQQKQALRDALRIVEGEIKHLRSSNSANSVGNSPVSASGTRGPPDPLEAMRSAMLTHSRSSSEVGLKSPPRSRSTSPLSVEDGEVEAEAESRGKDGKDEWERDKEALEETAHQEAMNQEEADETVEEKVEGAHSVITGGAPVSLEPPAPESPTASTTAAVGEDEALPSASTVTPSTTDVPSIPSSIAGVEDEEPSPWADVPSQSPRPSTLAREQESEPSIYATAMHLRFG